MRLIDDPERIAAAIQWTKTRHFQTWLETKVGKERAKALDQLSASTCCSVRHTGWAGQDQITFYSIMSGGVSHVVTLDAFSPHIRNIGDINISLNLCGDVVTTGD